MVGPVWESIRDSVLMLNIPVDERVLMSGKEYDINRDQWYVEMNEGQRCLFR
jgi:hypothetical protein